MQVGLGVMSEGKGFGIRIATLWTYSLIVGFMTVLCPGKRSRLATTANSIHSH